MNCYDPESHTLVCVMVKYSLDMDIVYIVIYEKMWFDAYFY